MIRRIPALIRTRLGDKRRRFRKQVKGLPEGGAKLPTAPCAVRNNEIQKTTFFEWVFLRKQSVGVAGHLQKADAFLEIGLVGLLVPGDLPQAAVLLRAEIGGELVEEVGIDPAIQLVDVHGVSPGLQAIIFSLEAGERRSMLGGLVVMALLQGRETSRSTSSLKCRRLSSAENCSERTSSRT